jgi:hypothetical protein
LVDLPKHLIFQVFHIVVSNRINRPEFQPRHRGQFRDSLALQPNPLGEKHIGGVKISADPIMESIQSNYQHGRGGRCEPLTVSQYFYVGLLKSLSDITFEFSRFKPKLFDLNVQGLNEKSHTDKPFQGLTAGSVR